MDKIIQAVKLTVEELNKFSTDLIRFGNPILDDRIEIFEKRIGYSLSSDFKLIIKTHNGFSLMGVEVLGLDTQFKDSSLEKVYEFEHQDSYNTMPLHFIPFSPDGYGNYYCLNINKMSNGLCPVVFWQHDYKYSSLTEVEETHLTFLDWINDVLISWTLEDYNYDGTEKDI